MSERHDTKVNACFGRSDLMQENHFRFARQSHLPRSYFDQDRYAERCLKALCVACILVLVAWFML